jgi:hypothetical protein
MSNLRDDLLFLEGENQSRLSCLVRTILHSLNENDRDALVTALANPAISGASISRTLISHGKIIKSGAINKHRKGDCSCDVLQ